MIKRILINGAKNGAALIVTTTTSLLLASANENDGAWGAINNVSHIVDGDETVYGDRFSMRDSSVGLAINSTAMLVWGLIYEVFFGRIELPRSLVSASFFAVAAYLVDYHLVPKRLTPGIEHKISRNSVYFMYLVIVFTLFLSPRWTRR
jgi:hypothetical protein